MTFPLTVDAVHRLRERHRFRTPLQPVEPGKPFCVFGQRGTWEWLAHPADAQRWLAEGVQVDGRRYPVAKIDEYPLMGAWHVGACDPDANQQFIEAKAA